ncbi:A24 family peptidase [Kibdelosporangium philippinense]|uniref:A24 family peptidase n=1 Tax=Kibdelosporangium philippinense TaxID=211113 RepID=A0ABS8ZH50_9PSEU|nr:A24 family peptidase [Kibdelosporangium philippinense]MCE7007100.1 A24 family peptidase [Kibdelosporangium philippinense]
MNVTMYAAFVGALAGLAMCLVVGWYIEVTQAEVQEARSTYIDRFQTWRQGKAQNVSSPLRVGCLDGHVRGSLAVLGAEVFLAGAFAILATRVYPPLVTVAMCWLTVLGGAAALVDTIAQRLPNIFTGSAYVGVTVVFAVQTLVVDHNAASFLRVLLSGAGLAAFYLLLAVISQGGLGFGDVKLSASVGTALGWIGVSAVFQATLLGSILACAALAVRRSRRNDRLAFGPFMFLSALLVLAWAP